MPGSGQGPAHSVPLSPSGYDDLAVDDGSSDDRQQVWRAVRRWLTMVVECAIDLDASIAQPVSRGRWTAVEDHDRERAEGDVGNAGGDDPRRSGADWEQSNGAERGLGRRQSDCYEPRCPERPEQ